MEGLATESFKPGKENAIFDYAAKFILNGMDEDTDLVFLTGKTGTGKTTFLKYIADRMKNSLLAGFVYGRY